MTPLWGQQARELFEGGFMDFLGMAISGFVPADAFAALAFAIIEIVALVALGVVIVGFIMTGLCEIFECRKLRQCHGGTETWQLMH